MGEASWTSLMPLRCGWPAFGPRRSSLTPDKGWLACTAPSAGATDNQGFGHWLWAWAAWTRQPSGPNLRLLPSTCPLRQFHASWLGHTVVSKFPVCHAQPGDNWKRHLGLLSINAILPQGCSVASVPFCTGMQGTDVHTLTSSLQGSLVSLRQSKWPLEFYCHSPGPRLYMDLF